MKYVYFWLKELLVIAPMLIAPFLFYYSSLYFLAHFSFIDVSCNNNFFEQWNTYLLYVQLKKEEARFTYFLNILLFQGRHRTHKPGTEACHILALLLHSTIGSCDVIEAASWWVILLFGW